MAVDYRSLSGSTGTAVDVKALGGALQSDPIPILSLDDTLPPTPIDDLVAAASLHVYVLAADAAVREAVRRACGERHTLTVADNWDSLIAAIDARQCDIAFIEASLLGTRLTKCVTELGRHARQVVTVLAADRRGAQELIGFLSERKIHRLLIKPPAPGITRLLLESAANRCLQLRSADVRAPLVPAVQAAPEKSGARIPTWVIATGVAGLVLGVAVILAVAAPRGMFSPGAATTTEPSAAPIAAPVDRFADLLARAELAFSEGRLAAPPGDNALEYYLTVLAAEPAHESARDRLASVVDALFAQAENALLAGSLDAAATALDDVRKATPTSGRLAFLDTQLARARADAARGSERAAAGALAASGDSRSPSPAVQAELERLLDAASARLRRGELLDPANDSAFRNLERAAELAGTDPRVIQLRGQLGAALIASARAVLDAGELDPGVRLTDAARKLGADTATMAVLDQKIAAGRAAQQGQRQLARVATARARIQSGALAAPAEDNALTILTAVEREAPQTQGLGDAFDALVTALAGSVRSAVERGDWPAAEGGVAALRATGHAPALTSSLARDLTTAQTQQEYLATAAPASELNLVSFSPPVYPADAQARQVEGWVEVEYVVDRAGLPRDLKVLQATPAGYFTQSALAAVAKYRYEPFTRDGQVYERRVRLRLRFSLK
jgi:periplasmic protein TonB